MFAAALALLLAADAPVPVVHADAQPPTTTDRVCRIAVLDLVGRGLADADAAFPALLSEVLTNEVSAASRCQVISQADIKSMVDFEATKETCAEGSDNCLAELGTALGVDRIVAGSIGRLGTDYVITVRLVDINRAIVEQRAEEVVSGQPERLRLAAKLVGRALFPLTRPAIEPVTKAPVVDAGPPLITPLFLGGVGVGVVGVVVGVVGTAMAFDADAKLGDASNVDKAGALGTGRAGFWLATGGVVAAVAGLGAGAFAAVSADL